MRGGRLHAACPPRYTGEHSAFVVEMAKTVAAALGLDEVEIERIAYAALLHDIGKVGMPDRVLHKPGPLAGEEIPLGSRIILACDAYHAMTSDRPYRAAMAHDHAIAELVRCAGSQFDPRIVAALVGHLGRGDGHARFTTPR